MYIDLRKQAKPEPSALRRTLPGTNRLPARGSSAAAVWVVLSLKLLSTNFEGPEAAAVSGHADGCGELGSLRVAGIFVWCAQWGVSIGCFRNKSVAELAGEIRLQESCVRTRSSTAMPKSDQRRDPALPGRSRHRAHEDTRRTRPTAPRFPATTNRSSRLREAHLAWCAHVWDSKYQASADAPGRAATQDGKAD